jgi:hypothetical protein
MHAVVRSYAGSGSKELFDRIVAAREEVEGLIRAVPGFVSYTLIRTADGGVTITVCRDKAGCDESVRVARGWVSANGSDLDLPPLTATDGSVDIHFGAS